MLLSEWIKIMQDELEKGGDKHVVLKTRRQLLPNSTYPVLPELNGTDTQYAICPCT